VSKAEPQVWKPDSGFALRSRLLTLRGYRDISSGEMEDDEMLSLDCYLGDWATPLWHDVVCGIIAGHASVDVLRVYRIATNIFLDLKSRMSSTCSELLAF